MPPVPRRKYDYCTVMADPPWPYNSDRAMPVRKELTHNQYGGNVSSRERYGSMTIEELKRLPVSKIVASHAHLYLWTTNSFIVEAHAIAEAWGFKPKTLLTWVKTKSDGSPSMKTGYYFRSATEHVLFCVRGSLKLQGDCQPTAYLLPRLPHSVKPEEFYTLAEICSPSPRIELFSRQRRSGWSAWGNEVVSDINI